ncbi:Uncharacterised protein [BD1-7 clade bacterium]|uniref:Uncharacterized protein n=1 Tax=BD1-7 clade bacterium TaxID=2029982 RepID=A0A5S9MQK1_9GAMM|nr:Uncharacterised protein [BD1-7 clade bacterium]CAA0084707.1 Uncharacterised protein [BD1-7 clade bacterium]
MNLSGNPLIQTGLVSLFLLLTSTAMAGDYDYQMISKRFASAALSERALEAAKMQGECLVGIKELNFRNQTQFDPIAEWSNYRTAALLEKYSPCEVLVMLEVAQVRLKAPLR